MDNGEEGDECSVLESDKMIRAVPLDCRLPWILIPVPQAKKWIRIPEEPTPSDQLFAVRLEKWNEASSLPLGSIVEYIGHAGAIDVEEVVCMTENGLENQLLPFSDEVEEESLRLVHWAKATHDEEVKQNREDFRGHRIFTIDPVTARDLDDAIHIVKDDSCSPVEYEIGVHIADVTHYLWPGTKIDTEATERCTTVYLTHKCFPMLPHCLCNELCSLNPNEEKLTVSALFRLTEDGELVKSTPPRFCRSVIRSCARFTYEEVQVVLDADDPTKVKPIVQVYNGQKWSDVVKDLKKMEELALRVRRRRFENGSLALHKVKLRFRLDKDTRMPLGYAHEVHSSSHELIEEFMLLANLCVAKKLHDGPLRDLAVLRRHREPLQNKLEQVGSFLKSLNIPFDFSTAGRIFHTILHAKSTFGPFVAQGVEQLLIKPFKPAQYFVRNDDVDPLHFALNFPLYTHFTSPIRRYPDILVHRLLFATLDMERQLKTAGDLPLAEEEQGEQIETLLPSVLHHLLYEKDRFEKLPSIKNRLDILCGRCNERKKASKEAQSKCDLSFFSLYLGTLDYPEMFLGTVTMIQDMSIVIFVNSLGYDKRIRFDMTSDAVDKSRAAVSTEKFQKFLEFPESFSLKSETKVEVVWNNDGSSSTQILKVFSRVPVWVVPRDHLPADFSYVLIPPWHSDFKKILAEDEYCGHFDEPMDLGGFESESTGAITKPELRESELRVLHVDKNAASRIVKHYTNIMNRRREQQSQNGEVPVPRWEGVSLEWTDMDEL